jgi:hypothetical protein
VLSSCSTGPHTASDPSTPPSRPAGPRELSHFLLLIQETKDGRVIHSWRPASGLTIAEFLSTAAGKDDRETAAQGVAGRSVQAAWNRDCEEERNTCEDNCMNSDLGPNWSHIKTRGAKLSECRNRCWRPYLDCCRLRDLEGERFHAIDDAVDWLKRHRTEVLVGTSIVIAGVAFVVIVDGTGGGILVLAPAVLLASGQDSLAPHTAAAKP